MSNQTSTKKQMLPRLLWGSLFLFSLMGVVAGVIAAAKGEVIALASSVVWLLPSWYSIKRFSKIGDDTSSDTSGGKALIEYKNVTLHATGASTFNTMGAKYSYLEFKDAEGNILALSKDNILITSQMHINFEPGAKGDFYFGTVYGSTFLVASNINGEKRTLDESEYSSNIAVLYAHYFASYNVSVIFVLTIFTLGLFLAVPLIQAALTASKHDATKKAVRALGF